MLARHTPTSCITLVIGHVQFNRFSLPGEHEQLEAPGFILRQAWNISLIAGGTCFYDHCPMSGWNVGAQVNVIWSSISH